MEINLGNYIELERSEVEEIMEKMCINVKEVTNVRNFLNSQKIVMTSFFLKLSRNTIRAFLNHMLWKEEFFLEKFVDDSDDLYDKFNIFKESATKMIENASNCEICYDEMTHISLKSCQHAFCELCLATYFTIKIDENSDIIKCPCFECNNIIEDELIKQLVSPDHLKKYQKRVLDEFIFNNLKLKNCQAPNCELVFKLLDSTSPTPIVCSRGHEFCFHCNFETSHYPLPCKMLQDWIYLLSHFGKTPASSIWIKENTKPCPKCKRPILKHEGCDHMYCTLCSHSYNWSEVTNFDTEKPFFVPSNEKDLELTMNVKRRKNDSSNFEKKLKTYDLEKIDNCTAKYIAALAEYRNEIKTEHYINDYKVLNTIKLLKKYNKLLIITAVLDFFMKVNLKIYCINLKLNLEFSG